MKEEKMKILQMIEEGKISAKDGMDLLAALESDNSSSNNNDIYSEIKPANVRGKAKWLKVKVYDPKEETNVKVNLPLTLVEVGLKIGQSFPNEVSEHLEGINIDEILELIQNGAKGQIVNLEKDDGTKVEVYIE